MDTKEGESRGGRKERRRMESEEKEKEREERTMGGRRWSWRRECCLFPPNSDWRFVPGGVEEGATGPGQEEARRWAELLQDDLLLLDLVREIQEAEGSAD